MWYKTKEGVSVFNVKHNGHFYQLTNDYPIAGDFCLVDLEHDPRHILKVKSFNPHATWQLNNEACYGGSVYLRDGDIDFYGICKIVWTDNPRLQKTYEKDRNELFDYWSKQQPHLTLDDF